MKLDEFLKRFSFIDQAKPMDNELLHKLNRSVSMNSGGLKLRYERSNNFLEANDEQGIVGLTSIFKNPDKSFSGMASIASREALINNNVERYAYLWDLRILKTIHKKTKDEWFIFYKNLLEDGPKIEELLYPKRFLTVVLKNNKKAIHFLQNKLPGIEYKVLHEIQTNIVFGPKLLPTSLKEINIEKESSEIRNFIKSSVKDLYYECPRDVTNDFLVLRKNGEILAVCQPNKLQKRFLYLEKSTRSIRLLFKFFSLIGMRPIKENSEVKQIYFDDLTFNNNLSTREKRECLDKLIKFTFKKYRKLYDFHAVSYLAYSEFEEYFIRSKSYFQVATDSILFEVKLKADKLNPSQQKLHKLQVSLL